MTKQAVGPEPSLWQASITLRGEPVTTLVEAQRIAGLVGDMRVDGPEDAENGAWLVEVGTRAEHHLRDEGWERWESVDRNDPWVVDIDAGEAMTEPEPKTMLAHDLARLLLAGPDRVLTTDTERSDDEARQVVRVFIETPEGPQFVAEWEERWERDHEGRVPAADTRKED